MIVMIDNLGQEKGGWTAHCHRVNVLTSNITFLIFGVLRVQQKVAQNENCYILCCLFYRVKVDLIIIVYFHAVGESI